LKKTIFLKHNIFFTQRIQQIPVWLSGFVTKEVALFSTFGIIYALQHFGNRKSASLNKLCN